MLFAICYSTDEDIDVYRQRLAFTSVFHYLLGLHHLRAATARAGGMPQQRTTESAMDDVANFIPVVVEAFGGLRSGFVHLDCRLSVL